MSATAIAPAASEAARAGAEWLRGRQCPDGSFAGCERDLAGYYKSILALTACGSGEAAARCVAYLRRNLLSADGELAADGAKTGLTRMQRNLASYMDGWVAIGAWLAEQFGLADTVGRGLVESQSRVHGGVLTGPERWAGPPRYDLATAASCGRAFLFTGRRSEAAACGEFLLGALARQPDLERGLDLAFDEEWTPLEAPDPSEVTYYRFDLAREGEKVWFPAFSAAFLCELHQLSGDRRQLDAARSYFELIRRTPEYRAGGLANGKSAWAASLLATATGEASYAEDFARIAPNVLARQRRDGEFAGSVAAAAGPAPEGPESPAELGRRLERTAEFSLWSAEFARFAAAADAGDGGAAT